MGRSAGGPCLDAPDFVCDAIAEVRQMHSLGLKPVWQGSGFGLLGSFETWEIRMEEAVI